MRELSKYLVALLIGVSLLFGVKLAVDNSEMVANSVINPNKKCEQVEGIGCPIGNFFYRVAVGEEVLNTAYILRRQSIPKSVLPNLRIYMDGAALGKLQTKRTAALAKHWPMLVTDKDSWVNATVVAEGATGRLKSKVSLRLKGDWGDHLRDPRKVSFRIKVKSGGNVFGYRRFSIQRPKTRRFENEPLLLDHMRAYGILAPRYSFIFVYVNDIAIGVMAMEEHMSKEMLEAQRRREGPILAFDEELYWAQLHAHYNITKRVDTPLLNFDGLRDSAIKIFNNYRYVAGSIATNHAARGHALLRDFYDGRKSAREVFDYKKLAAWWVLTNVWDGCHSIIWHNRRYFYNPITGLLEPVSFDNGPRPHRANKCFGGEIKAALLDPSFAAAVKGEIASLRKELASKEFADWFDSRKGHYRKILDLEKSNDNRDNISIGILPKNLNEFEEFLAEHLAARKQQQKPVYRPVDPSFSQAFLATKPVLASHITAFYIPGTEGGSLEVRNLTLEDIDLTSVHVDDGNGTRKPVEFGPAVLPSTSKALVPATFRLPIPMASFDSDDAVTVSYTYKGEPFSRSVRLQYRHHVSVFANNFVDGVGRIRTSGAKPIVDAENKRLEFGKGVYGFDEHLAAPWGWTVVVNAGATLNFVNGALLKLRGPLQIEGREDAPVVMNIRSDSSFKGMGSWGGILVSQSPVRSSIKHLLLKGSGNQNLPNRQDYHGLTGCLTFYESDVDITDAKLQNAHCEDALNIANSDLALKNVHFADTRADAFDGDFSTGRIHNSTFTNSGNDAIDVSGSTLAVSSVELISSGDKAISVGEASTLTGEDLVIAGGVIGVASKDLSSAKITNTTFDRITGAALMSYIKKPEYGPSSIECSACKFAEGLTISTRQEGTTIVVNGISESVAELSREQMRHVGIIE